ncbi:hypothetical protein LNI90_10500 [Tenacibaculum dicentrarchi]|uniref:hypothetical protein n=1 Tax=Tenacibaculum dicentrarchi TaxID=669041 RepID=UPI001E3119DC|nr:hypothetical protein [Tenacibaculum dicentrarchi]MCG8838788.1 hypothetical protein [Tenacibaculum dicentrarchi]
MKICVLKELKKDENRVSLLPKHVSVLVENNHTVLIEKNAGLNSGYTDQDYINSGAIILSKEEVLQQAELILKVKAPLKSEFNDYKEGQVLFTYLHFDENIIKEDILEFIKTKFLGIAYEWVGDKNNYPLLRPMSKITGYLFAQKSIELLSKYKGKLAGAYEIEHKSAEALIIGLGTIGTSALKYFLSNNLKVTIVDKNPDTLNDRVNKRFKTDNIDYLSKVNVIKFDMSSPYKVKEEISKIINKLDIVLNCAVRRSDLSKSNLDYIIDNNMIKMMEKGSVVCDTTGCDKDLIESCVSSSELEYVDFIEGVVHYNCDHIPSAVANTSSQLLTEKTFPYILELANEGIEKTLKTNKFLNNGVSCYKGYITHLYSADKKNMLENYKSINELLN